MNRPLVWFGAFLLMLGLPATASAQCEGMCSRLMKQDGQAIYGCYHAPGSVYDCWATATRCTLIRCSTALLTTPEGRVVGVRNGCDQPQAVPARVASALRGMNERVTASLALRLRTLALAQRAVVAGRA